MQQKNNLKPLVFSGQNDIVSTRKCGLAALAQRSLVGMVVLRNCRVVTPLLLNLLLVQRGDGSAARFATHRGSTRNGEPLELNHPI
jgi:hypothetical protein